MQRRLRSPFQTEGQVPVKRSSPLQRLQALGGERAIWIFLIGFALVAAVAYTEQFVVGLIVGSLYALAAVGLTLIYGITRTPHFAHGDAMMLGAYLAFFALFGVVDGATFPVRVDQLPGATEPIWRFSFGYGLIVAMLLSAAVIMVLLVGIDRVVYRPLHRRSSSTALLAVASLGVAIAMRGFILLVWGGTPRKYTPGIRKTVDFPGGIRLVADQLFIIAAALVLAALVALLLYRTRTGRAMRAMANNPDLARVCGIVVADITRWTWVVGGALITVAGVLLGLQSQLSPDLGFILLLPIFAAAIMGGIGSPAGALIGGLSVGVISEVTVAVGVISPGYKTSIAFVVLILIILVRPSGLFGERA